MFYHNFTIRSLFLTRKSSPSHPHPHKSKYMICVALIAPQKLRKAATLTTAVVVPDQITILPMHSDRMNWARNTMLLTMATSVPSPRTSVPVIAAPSASRVNW